MCQALKELSSFVVVDGIAQKVRQKLLRNLRVCIALRLLHMFHRYVLVTCPLWRLAFSF